MLRHFSLPGWSASWRAHRRLAVLFQGSDRCAPAGYLPHEPHEDHRANGCDENCPEHTAAGPEPQHVEHRTTYQSAHKTEYEIHQYAVARALHDLACEEAGNDANDDRDQHESVS